MVLSDIKEVMRDTAMLLDISPPIVEDVMRHVFKSMRKFFRYPDAVGVQFSYFGTFVANSKAIRYAINTELIKRIRRNPEKYIDDFRVIWKLKQLAYKNDERRKYKERFGSWHFK
jgi:nucleoid DNA-binding protein